MEEERVRKLKTVVGVRRDDYGKSVLELTESIKRFRQQLTEDLDKRRIKSMESDLEDTLLDMTEKSQLLIDAYSKYVKALENLVPKPDWETP